jgi:hypothetical protein
LVALESRPKLTTLGVASVATGVIAAEAGDGVDVVALPEGVTINVYDTPLVRPLTVQVCAGLAGIATEFATVHDRLPGVYDVAVPSGVNVTFIVPEPAVFTVGWARVAAEAGNATASIVPTARAVAEMARAMAEYFIVGLLIRLWDFPQI